LHLYHRLFGLNWVALRLSNPYGIRQDPISVQGVIAVFAARMLQQKPVVIWGIGDTTRDFINVRDVADLFYKAMNSEANGVFNVGSGVGVSINALLAIMSSQLGVVPVIVREPPRKVDVPAIVLDCERARKTFSWAPRVSLEEGIIEVGDWLRGDVIDSANNSGALAWQTKGEETCKSEVRLQESIHFIR
jgi:UDP-glucose 4-epimerase